MGLKTLLGIKKRKWTKSVSSFISEMRNAFPNYNWNEFFEIAEHFHRREMSSMNERAFLFRLSRDLPPDSTVVEIGSWIGESTCYLATGLKGDHSKLYAIDRFTGHAENPNDRTVYSKLMTRWTVSDTKSIFDQNIERFHLQKRVHPIVSDSIEAASTIPLAKESVDLLFIDGDHAESAAQKDFDTWYSFVKPNGIIAFHDFSSTCGVPNVVWRGANSGKFGELLGIHNTMLAARKI